MTSHTHPSRRRRVDDQGFTLMEVLVVLSTIGIVSIALAMVFTVIVRTLPSAEVRIDDARTTRGLATWLSRDTTSTPPFFPANAQGGFDVSSTANSCNAPGSNIVQLRWVEEGQATTTFVANYRYVPDGSGEATVVRYICSHPGTSGTFGAPTAVNLTSGLDASSPPLVVLDTSTGDVGAMTFSLTAMSGENVLVETGPRNPSDFFS